MAEKLHLRGDWVLCEKVERDRVTDGGIVLPDTVEQESDMRVRVKALGAGVEGIKVGDEIIYHGRELVGIVNRKPYLLIQSVQVIGVLTGKPDPATSILAVKASA